MPTARMGLGTAVVNGKIYAIGGFNGTDLGVNEMYDPATNIWTEKSLMPTPRSYCGIVVWQNKIYVFGGNSNWNGGPDMGDNSNVTEVYDPSTDSWAEKAPLPFATSNASGVLEEALVAGVYNGEIYVMNLNFTEVYDNASKTWNAPVPLPVTINIYDPVMDNWTIETPPPMPYDSIIPPPPTQGYSCAAFLDGRFYIILNGMQRNYSRAANATQIFDLNSGSWSEGQTVLYDDLSFTWVSFAASAATSGEKAPKQIFVIGGGDWNSLGSNLIYSPSTDSWIQGAYMPTTRSSAAVAVVDDALYVIGGSHIDANGPTVSNVGVTGANEEYTPFG